MDSHVHGRDHPDKPASLRPDRPSREGAQPVKEAPDQCALPPLEAEERRVEQEAEAEQPLLPEQEAEEQEVERLPEPGFVQPAAAPLVEQVPRVEAAAVRRRVAPVPLEEAVGAEEPALATEAERQSVPEEVPREQEPEVLQAWEAEEAKAAAQPSEEP